jgi:DNA-binding NarL/FixJ family response regulator
MSIQVLLADDQQLVRQGLGAMLENEGFRIVGEASDGHEAIAVAAATHPDIAVLDLAMPRLNGVDAARELLRAVPGLKTLLLTMHSEEDYVLQALSAGIKGYVLKTQAAADLVQAIREIMRGGVYLSPGISQTVVEAYRSRMALPSEPLTMREREVLQLVAEGKTTKEIAAILCLSVKTIESHRTRLMNKLDIHEIAGLVRYAIRRGMVQA